MIREKRPVELISTGIIFLLCGVLFVGVHELIQDTAKEAAKWPTTEAKVRFTEIIKDDHINNPATYRHGVVYDFQVDGKAFSGETLHLGENPPTWSSEDEARKSLPQIGSTIQIHYNPGDPKKSVAHAAPASPYEYWLGVIGRGTLIAFGLVLICLGVRKWEKPHREPVSHPLR